MPEIIASITSAIAIVKNLSKLSDKLKNAELNGLIADLSLEMSELKMRMSELVDENTQLKAAARALDSPVHDPCPRCGKRTWKVESSRPDRDFGDMGGMIRTYKCAECAFTEDKFSH